MSSITVQDKIRGSLFGGAVGDALGYAVEFWGEDRIFSRFGKSGIAEYDLIGGKALISDDTQMSLFTANGLLYGDTRGNMRGIRAAPHDYVAMAYQDWLRTQEMTYEESRRLTKWNPIKVSWLADVPELYSLRAPGNTCLSALELQRDHIHTDGVEDPINHSKGCGGVMRVAPLALNYNIDIEQLDREGAEIAAITHGHPLGYLPAAVLTHIINRIVFQKREMTLKEIVLEAKDTVERVFAGTAYLDNLSALVELAVELSENDSPDLENIHELGEGWVAEETLAIAIYCSLRHQNDFSAGVIASVNHKGDSDSTGAVTGNILGALLGYDAMEPKWKENLELADVILELADDVFEGCRMTEYGDYRDPVWIQKYIKCQWNKKPEVS